MGGPYALMQVYAWAGMLAEYSQDSGFAQAAVDTFSGEKPCELCCKIAAAKDGNRETPADSSFSNRKLIHDMIPGKTVEIHGLRGRIYSPPGFFAPSGVRGRGAEPPPVPPPCA
ncbi:MAG: hypothetical protein V4733_05545 [Verrucomicrobiota bacterium]